MNSRDLQPVTVLVGSSSLSVRVSATPASGIAPLTVNFSAVVVSGEAPIALTWNFGDGAIVPGGLTESHTYETAGEYEATLTATDAALDLELQSVNLTVLAALQSPRVVASALTIACDPKGTLEQLNFTTVGGVGPFTGSWDFGDGASAPASNTTHFYAANGSFQVGLFLTDSYGRSARESVVIAVPGPSCDGAGIAPPRSPIHPAPPWGYTPPLATDRNQLPATLGWGGGIAVAAVVIVLVFVARRRTQREP
jgi:endoglucanase